MNRRIESFLRSIFSIFMIIAVSGGIITFILFLIAIIIGGKGGETLAVNTGKVYLPYFINAAAVAIMSGLIVLYMNGSHSLSLQVERTENITQPEESLSN